MIYVTFRWFYDSIHIRHTYEVKEKCEVHGVNITSSALNNKSINCVDTFTPLVHSLQPLWRIYHANIGHNRPPLCLHRLWLNRVINNALFANLGLFLSSYPSSMTANNISFLHHRHHRHHSATIQPIDKLNVTMNCSHR